MTVKEFFENRDKSYSIKTHMRAKDDDLMDWGITGFYMPDDLIKAFPNNECWEEFYEKDYGDGAVAVRSFFVLIVDTKEIVKEWERK